MSSVKSAWDSARDVGRKVEKEVSRGASRTRKQARRSLSDAADAGFLPAIATEYALDQAGLGEDPVAEELKRSRRQAEQDARDREAQEAQAQGEARRRREAMSRRALADRPDLFSLLGGPQRQRLG